MVYTLKQLFTMKGVIFMKRKMKIISAILIAAITFTSATPVMAQTNISSADAQITILNSSDISYTVPEEFAGMEQFLSKNVDGTVSLNTAAALAANYDEQLVFGVQENLARINEGVLSGNTYVDNSFIAHSYNSDIMPLSTLAQGRSEIETTWYGDIFIYMNSDEAECLYQAFDSVSSTCGNLLIALDRMPSDPDANKVHDYITAAVAIVGVSALIYRNLVGNAKAPGTGIVWYIHQDFNTGAVGWAFDSQ